MVAVNYLQFAVSCLNFMFSLNPGISDPTNVCWPIVAWQSADTCWHADNKSSGKKLLKSVFDITLLTPKCLGQFLEVMYMAVDPVYLAKALKAVLFFR